MEQVCLPIEFEQRMKRMLNEDYDAFLYSYNNDDHQAFRFNPLKRGLHQEDYGKLLKHLGIQEMDPVNWAEYGYYYEQGSRPGKHPYHEMGLYYIQEPSAMSAAALLKPQPGERVLDLCAAPGGKTTQLASYLGGEGLLISNEIHPERSNILAQNVERMGIANAIVMNEECETLSARFPSYFHKIQVDAPCSGEGMFRKNPEAINQWSEEQVQVCADRQLMIMNEAAKMLMPGGTMVYSTCTFAPEENEALIDRFLCEHEEFEIKLVEAPWFEAGKPEWGNGREELSRTFRLYPHRLRGEGHFLAVLQKKGIMFAETSQNNGKKDKKAGKNGPDKKQMEELQTFMNAVLKEEISEFIRNGKLLLFGDNLYRLPAGAPAIDGLKVKRAGLHIGSFKKNRFEPSHALALYLSADDVQNSWSVQSDSTDAVSYFSGNTIQGDGKNGYCLVCVDGYSAGWGKITNGTIKNHYPKGLRKNFF